jgi:hypothetical protein
MNLTQALKDRIVVLAGNMDDLAMLERLAPVWKSAVEAEKAEIDIADAATRRRSESVRFWVPILAPIVASVALIATLGFQIYQFHQQAKMTAQTAEDAGWRDVINRAKNVRNPEGAFALSLIKPFLDSPRYAKSAREISVGILGHMADSDSFSVLFPEILNRADPANTNDIIRIAANLNRLYHNIPTKEEFAHQRSAVERNITTVGRALGELLKRRTDSGRIDLAQVQFGTIDLVNANMANASLREAILFNCDVTNATFSGIEGHDGSDWQQTAWWRARVIDPGLLEYLQSDFPFYPNVKYNGAEQPTASEYAKALQTLKARAQKV